MNDAAIIGHLEDMGHEPGRGLTPAELRDLCARIEADCASRVQSVADRYRPIVDGRVDHQAQIARNAALSCVAAIKEPAC